MTPREEAQIEAEKTYVAFLEKSKRVLIVSVLVLLLLAFCSDFDTPTNYNGEVYAPKNIGEDR
tara:strand:+ start:439 stop:627 length:189 start_codon:yes stop_codon:yes gene_type:complete